ncbi:MAG: dihydroxyacetone kinase family protein [Beutenbergiaceae bacterium]
MTYLKHDQSTFALQAAAAFSQVHADLVQPVPGGVIRATRHAQDEVAVVIGGGSGHYPAFAGLVGPGLAHGAVLGNIFASPSSEQVESLARTVDQGRGVLLTYGNYAGDTLQFDAAARRLEERGIPVRTVRVSDDISSAPATEKDKRRGIAGDLVVFKIAGAAAAAGHDLQEVHRLAAQANERTRSLGVAFTGCTLPGSSQPLATVPPGRMAVGLGIHGEPGLEETDIPTPAELAELLVQRILQEAPTGEDLVGSRVVVVINGIGAVKFDELFVVYGQVRHQLEEAGIVVADSKVGEFCTSFEMAGLSLTLLWLTQELEPLWRAPARSAEYLVADAAAPQVQPLRVDAAAAHQDDEPPPVASEASRAAAGRILPLLERLRTTVADNAQQWGHIDSLAGDGDHGIGMDNGSQAALAAATSAVQAGAGVATMLSRAGTAWSVGAGGTSGALWGLMLRVLGQTLGDQEPVTGPSVRRAVRNAADAVMEQGGARVGDKTMVDALAPFADALASPTHAHLADAWRDAAAQSKRGAQATSSMTAALGRARSHGDRSIGVPDPGAVSFAQIVTDIAGLLEPSLTPRSPAIDDGKA